MLCNRTPGASSHATTTDAVPPPRCAAPTRIALQPIRQVQVIRSGHSTIAGAQIWFEALLRPGGLDAHCGVLPYIRRQIELHNERQLDAAVAAACRELAPSLAPKCRLSINVFAASLEHQDHFRGTLLPDLRAIASRLQVCIELSELTEIVDYTAVQASLQAFRHEGMLVALDDLGSGCCHMKLLGSGLVDIVKLDSELCRGLDTSPRMQSLIHHLTRYCADTGSTLVLEGIETRETLELAGQLGVEWAQGYAIGRPAFAPLL